MRRARSRRTRGVVLNPGTRPAAPPIDGLDATPYWTNRDAVQLTELPGSLVVLGGGPIGCELAQTFARFGVRVTILQHGDRLVPANEPEASAILEDVLVGEGIRVMTSAETTAVSYADGAFTLAVGDETIVADKLLVAAGRTPNLDDLGLESIGLDPSARTLDVDDRLRLAGVDGVWAIGDVTGKGAFTHVSMYQSAIALRDVLEQDGPPASYHALPHVTFTDPEVAGVGLSEQQARDAGLRVRVGSTPLEQSSRGFTHGPGARGVVKVVEDADRGVLVGATVVGPAGGEILGFLAVAVHAAVPVDTLRTMIYAYPTFHRAIETAIGGPLVSTTNADRADQSEWLDRIAAAGLVAFGVVHLIIGWLAVQLALGDREGGASSSGAVKKLAQQPFGEAMVLVVALGMVLLVIWRGIEAAVGYQDEENPKRLYKRVLSAGKAVVYASIAFSAFSVATGSKSSSGGGTDSMTATLMDRPAGQLLVGAVGLGIIGVGIGLLVVAWRESYLKKLDAEGRSGNDGHGLPLAGPRRPRRQGALARGGGDPLPLRRGLPRARRSPAGSTRHCAPCSSSPSVRCSWSPSVSASRPTVSSASPRPATSTADRTRLAGSPCGAVRWELVRLSWCSVAGWCAWTRTQVGQQPSRSTSWCSGWDPVASTPPTRSAAPVSRWSASTSCWSAGSARSSAVPRRS